VQDASTKKKDFASEGDSFLPVSYQLLPQTDAYMHCYPEKYCFFARIFLNRLFKALRFSSFWGFGCGYAALSFLRFCLFRRSPYISAH
jgi:hypothetical protein